MGDLQKELEETKAKLALYERVLRHSLMAEKSGYFFICGVLGNIDENGLPDKILICPSYGVDWAQVYEKSEKSTGPEW